MVSSGVLKPPTAASFPTLNGRPKRWVSVADAVLAGVHVTVGAAVIGAVAPGAGLVVVVVGAVAVPLVKVVLVASRLTLVGDGIAVVGGNFLIAGLLVHGFVGVATVLKQTNKRCCGQPLC